MPRKQKPPPIVTEPAPTPTPTPTPTPSGISTVGAIRICPTCDSGYNLNQGWAYVTLHDRSTAWADMPTLHSAGAKLLAYKNTSFVTDDWPAVAGMGYAEADPSWFLLRNGERIRSVGWKYETLMDIGNVDYQNKWVENVIRDCKAHGYDGIHMDDVNDGFSMGSHLNYSGTWYWPDKYPATSQTSITFPAQGFSSGYQNAMESFLKNVGPKLKAAGLIAMPNLKVGNYWTLDGVSRWQRWSDLCSGACDEFFSKGGSGSTKSDGTRQSYSNVNGNWANKLRLMELTEQKALTDPKAGIFLGIFSTTPEDLQSMRYARASFLMGWNGAAKSAVVFQPNPMSLDPWHEEWTQDLGHPMTARFTVVDGTTAVIRRNFEKGYAIINTHPTQSLNGIPPLDAQVVVT